MAALEAAMIGLLLISSVALVTTMEAERPAPRPTRMPLEDAVQDLLQGLEEVPTGDRFNLELSRIIARSVHANTTAWEHLLERTLPTGSECRLWLDNGHQRRHLAGPDVRLASESVSSSRLWRPTWSYAYAVPTLEVVSEAQPLSIQGYQVSQGSLVKEAGIPVEATLTTSEGLYDRAAVTSIRSEVPSASVGLKNSRGEFTFQASDPLVLGTVPLHNATAAGPVPSPVNFTVPDWQQHLNLTAWVGGTTVAYVLKLTSPSGVVHQMLAAVPSAVALPYLLSVAVPEAGQWTFSATGTVAGGILGAARVGVWVNSTGLLPYLNATVLVRSSGDVALPVGTNLTVHFPIGFSNIELTNPAQTGWRNITHHSDSEGPWITAELDTPLQGDREFVVRAKRPVDANAMTLATATLSGVVAARSNLVLELPVGVTTSINPLEHDLYLSVPKPMVPGLASTWGAVFAHSRTLASLAETITQLDLRSVEGTPLFENVTGVSPPGTWEVVSPTHLRWRGTEAVGANTAVSFVFIVRPSNLTSPDEEAIHHPVSFRSGSFTMRDQERPYVHTLSVPPSKDLLGNPQNGYEVPRNSTNASADRASFTTGGLQRGMLATGTADYQVTRIPSVGALQEALRSGLARSHLEFDTLTAKVNQTFRFEVDFQGVFDDVYLDPDHVLSNWNVEVRIFDPTQPFVPRSEMVPSFAGRFGANGTVTFTEETPDVATIPPWIVSGLPDVRTPARANLTLTVPKGALYGPYAIETRANFVIEYGAGESLVQSVTALGLVEVIPDAGQSATALYWVTLECWLPDWA